MHSFLFGFIWVLLLKMQELIGIILVEAYNILLMEETPKTLNFQVQLQNLSILQSKIQETRRSLNQLAKLQTNQSKSIEAMYKLSLMTTRNKLNLFQTHALSKSIHAAENSQLKAKQERVREIKQREERERKQIRQELKRNKENQRLLVRNNSLQYDQAIKKNRKLQIQKKEQMIRQVKQERQQFKQTLVNSRIAEKQHKEVALFTITLAKIERQPSLAKQLTKLMKQREEMELRVMQRREAKEKMKMQIDKLKKMKEDELATILKVTQAGHHSLGEKALSTRMLFIPNKI